MLSDSPDYQSATRLDKRNETNAVAVTLINDNNYHLDSYYCCRRNERCSPAVMLARFSLASCAL